jgi:lambda repressor-like predicted transcriptional regulator
VTSISGVSSTASLDPTQQTQRKDPFSNVASLLDMSASDLRSALKSGESMSDLATSKGVSRDDLLSAITKDLPQGTGSGAAASSTDADALAAKIADTKGLPQGGHGHGHHHHRVSGTATAGSSATTTATTATTAAPTTATTAATTDLATLLAKVGQQATGGSSQTGTVDGWI